MAKGVALTVGVDSLDQSHYAEWYGTLLGAVEDARYMATLARSQGFEITSLFTSEATRGAVSRAIKDAAARLAPGDTFLLTYAGHGASVPDINGDERDPRDETWCLYDGQILDDELYALWGKFEAGVRIVVVSDSCYSGTVTMRLDWGKGPSRYRSMPTPLRSRVYLQNREFYDGLQRSLAGSGTPASVRATVLLLSACRDDQRADDGYPHGYFTARLKDVWEEGPKYRGSYTSFHAEIEDRMPRSQIPMLTLVGAPDAGMKAQAVFSI